MLLAYACTILCSLLLFYNVLFLPIKQCLLYNSMPCYTGSKFMHLLYTTSPFLKRFYLFLERGREGEREGEKHQCVVASCMTPSGDLAHNPGMCLRLGIEMGTLWFTGWHSFY